jgi:hypothetical protein
MADRPSFRASLANFFTYDAPFTTRVKLTVTNNVKKLRTRSNCCGNHGQPGC